MDKKALQSLLNRPENANKYDFGHVLIVGGSAGMTGAPLLAGEAALRTGAGLVTIGAPKSVAEKLNRRVVEIMTTPLSQTDKQSVAASAVKTVEAFIAKRKVTTLAIGPGLSRHPQTMKFVRELTAAVTLPMVIDADGLAAFSGHLATLKAITGPNRAIIVTPHPGEFSNLTGLRVPSEMNERKTKVGDFAKKYQLICILKGHTNIIADASGQVAELVAGNPGMAKAGSGDVLCGMIAALLAQRFAPLEAARLAVELHGRAGDLAAKQKTQAGMIATDIISAIPEALNS